jgi:hypothetical protein
MRTGVATSASIMVYTELHVNPATNNTVLWLLAPGARKHTLVAQKMFLPAATWLYGQI